MSRQPVARHVQCFGGPRDGQRYTVTADILPIGDFRGEYVLKRRFTRERPRRDPRSPYPPVPGYEFYLQWVPEPRDVA